MKDLWLLSILVYIGNETNSYFATEINIKLTILGSYISKRKKTFSKIIQ